jgi:DNA-binding transcriptional ArsR family regulator
MNVALLQLLADQSRFQIIEILGDGERAVNDIVHRMNIEQSGVSRHLGILEKAGVVASRADGVRRLYSLCPQRFQELDRWMARYRSLWEAKLDSFGEALAHSQRAADPKKRRRMT